MKTATDPTTGKKVYWDGQQWLPLKTATNPQTGAQVGIAGGQTFSLSTPTATPSVSDMFGPEMAARETLRGELEQVVQHWLLTLALGFLMQSRKEQKQLTIA